MPTSRRHFIAASAAAAALTGRVEAAASRAWALPAKGAIKRLDVVRIPMSDGARLCGRIWLPADADRKPAPMVLEYIPYRTRDAYSAADDHWGGVLASYGVGYARIDIRGSGDSEGLLADEYLALEQKDGAEIIAWLAAQPWCSGAVGMRGISWGGFSTLQTAMLAPPALKAIMPMACSDRRYTDDAHYVGGCLGLTNLKWGVNFRAVMAGPPDPAVAGSAWEEMWRARLDAAPPIISRWMSHQSEDDYWRHGSLTFDYGAIRCPTYVVGGWADAYVHSVPRLLEGLKVPRKALVGPWGHTYPWLGGPGPALDWAFEEVRWWSHWLMGQETGIMGEPMLRFFRPDATPAQSAPGATPGDWGAEAVWPSKAVASERLFLTDKGLTKTSSPSAVRHHRSDNAVGLQTPEWVPFGQQEMPKDQTPDDERSMSFDTPPLPKRLELLGVPSVRLKLAADRPVAQVAVRLNKLTPDGKSWRLAYGLLNLSHRLGHDRPTPLTPGEPFEVEISLGFLAQRLRPGERLRLAISEGLWPLVWPSPDQATLTLYPGDSVLVLPVRAAPRAEPAMPIGLVPIPADAGDVVVTTTTEADRLKMSGVWPDKARKTSSGTQLSGFGPNTECEIIAGHPNRGRWSGRRVSRYQRADWNCELQSDFDLTSTSETFQIRESLTALKDGVVIFERSQTQTLPRRLI